MAPLPLRRIPSRAWWLTALLALAGLIGSCMESAELTSRTATAPEGPNCASCHAYPLLDTNHQYHLFHAGDVKRVNGKITCLDCHSNAIASHRVAMLDSIFEDSIGNAWSSLDLPNDKEIRTFTLIEVDTVIQDHPTAQSRNVGPSPAQGLSEYITSLAHLNGRVDVVFSERVTDSARFPGMKAEWLPEKETCSAMACHPVVETPYWRFAAPLKGLRELRGDSGDVP